jgi:mono/diheme cytochrome c family protein
MLRCKNFGLLVFLFGFSACSSDGGPAATLPESGAVDAGDRDAVVPADAKLDVSVPSPDAAPPPVDAAVDAADSGAYLADYPRLLSQTGLYSDITTETLGEGVRAFQPRYTLWSDGATKRRYVYLPPGEQIDTSDMDFWVYPVGTTAWKEFTRNGIRVETRMLRKHGPASSDWTMIAYQWKTDQSDAVAVPAGSKNANGTPHDIPAQKDCLFCHGNMKDVLLGVTAIQLSHSNAIAGLGIDDLVEEKRLSAKPSAPIQIPGDAVAEGALGYLHANCGLCHNSQSKVARTTPLRLWESTLKLETVETTLGYETTVGAANSFLPELHVVEPGRPDESELVIRISERGIRQMPPIATEVVDEDGVAKIRAWVESIPRTPDGGTKDAGSPDGGVSDAGVHDASIADGRAGASPPG